MIMWSNFLKKGNFLLVTILHYQPREQWRIYDPNSKVSALKARWILYWRVNEPAKIMIMVPMLCGLILAFKEGIQSVNSFSLIRINVSQLKI